ncbi:molybdopterin molybdotransferase MoeA [Curvibacter sp. HBC61]|uniref:Molybdopterin molybdenumtransferase n=1 Tax=Curvibacter cyanobacteriorum TaxID=3026422 RepID=A0ABT5MWV8_9BURK|nr:gephyrin-like molybdotransferase Glp [Curvibacter sp. HBC61]MDD0838548.1 molybdopterin molybdotransferase MoeA [Curvibacter sp. HBC61]
MNAPAAPAFKPLRPLDEVLSELLAYARPLNDQPWAHEPVSTFEADGRVLAEEVLSPLQVPPHDNSAMDGYAVRCAEVVAEGTVLPVSQRIAAGAVPQPLQPGTAARIFTGAPIPPGADAVLMQEDCEALSDAAGAPQVRLKVLPRPGLAIRRAGEDVALGRAVLSAGQRLHPASLGLAASVGRATLSVARRPRVALFSTGDELVMPGEVAPEQLPAGAIYNSNRFFLRALLLRMGCEVSDLGIVPDDLAATQRTLAEAAAGHDLILTSGGVSVGEEDHVKPAVQALGELHLWQLAIKPGKPFAYGRVAQSHFVGLPGNPVSSFITFLLLVRPFLLRLQGVQDVAPKPVPLPAHFVWAKADKRREFLRVWRNPQGGLDLFANQGSGVLTSAVWGDGVVDNAPGTRIAHGDLVPFISFAELLS